MRDVMKIAFFIILFTTSFLLFNSLEAGKNFQRKEEDYNVILITAESLRADRLGTYGYKRNTTPNIDRLAEESLVFTDAVSPSGATAHSISQIMSSKYLHADNISEEIDIGQVYFRYENSLVDKINQAGYSTVGIAPHTNLQEFQGFGKNFDTYLNPLPHLTDYTKIETFRENKYLIFPEFEPLKKYLKETEADELTEMAVSQIEKQNSSYFMWLHYMDPHTPYMPPEREYVDYFRQNLSGKKNHIGYYNLFGEKLNITERQKERLKNLYDSEVRFLDEHIGSLVDHLKETDQLDDTVIIFTGDHGECLGEHRLINHNRLYRCSVNVPMLVHIPGEGHERIDTPVSGIDIMPTILDVLNIKTDRVTRGESMLKPEEERRGYRYLEMAENHYRLIGDGFERFVMRSEDVYTKNPRKAEMILEDIRNPENHTSDFKESHGMDIDRERREFIEESLESLGY